MFLPENSNLYSTSNIISNEKKLLANTLVQQSANEKDKEIVEYLKSLPVSGKRGTMLDRFPIELRAKISNICDSLEIDEKHLYKVIYYESQGNPKARNPFSRATGLIQFVPSTAIKLGTNIDELYKMSSYDQLDYVYKYLENRNKEKKFTNTYNDLHLSIFYPNSRGKRGDYIIADTTTLKGKTILMQNASLDINKDKVLTVSEFITKNSKSS